MLTKELNMRGAGEVYSNFDHTLDKEVLKEVIENPGTVWGGHAAWEFYGHIYFKDGLFHEEILRYRVIQETLSNESLEDLIAEACSKYGSN
jgi:hypothetical protein